MLAAAFQSLQLGDFFRSEMLGRQVLLASPDDEGALLVLALSLDAQQRGAEALPLFRRLTQLLPGASGHWSNYGNALRMLGRNDEAQLALQQALALDPDEPNAGYNLGLLELDAGQFHRAHEHLAHAARCAPDDPPLRAALANAAFLSGDAEEAERLLEGWPEWTSDDPMTCTEVGWIYVLMGIADQAEAALKQAANALPGHPKVQVRRAALFERANRLDEARALLDGIDEAAVAAQGMQEDLQIVRAQVTARATDIPAAIARFEAIVASPTSARRHPELLSAIARLQDKQGNAALAMHWADRAHAIQMQELRSHSPRWALPDAGTLQIAKQRVSAARRRSWSQLEEPTTEESPLFVVGFPRSGTTMLETMLDAHPLLVGMDERSFLQNLVEPVRALGLDYPDELGALDDDACDKLRGQYWRMVKTRVQLQPGQRLVDKNPLNILRLPLISRLFPRAKIILALRHPCDVVLSNYLQNFRTPAYVALCATLESTAKGYAEAFDFWLDQAAVLRPDALELRYEDVVDDIDTQSRRIADFAGVDWDQRMVDFHDRAKERGYIATPSYHQVVEPLNRKGVARWERYREYLEPVIPHLQPYLDRWNYPV